MQDLLKIMLTKNRHTEEITCVDSPSDQNDIKFPTPSAKVEINYSGICGSDIHIIHRSRLYPKHPRILGHEACGTVNKILAGLYQGHQNLSEGNFVAINPIISCGSCKMCKQGKTNLCLNRILLGSDIDGLLQENVIVPLNNLFAIDNLPDKRLGALIEPLAVAVHSVKIAEEFGLESDEDILLFGAGKISLFISLVLKERVKPQSITVIGLNKDIKVRLPIFRECGINTYTFDQLFEKEGGKLDLSYFEGIYKTVFEVSGSEDGIKAAIKSLESGGSLIAVGLAESEAKIDTNCIVRRELRFVGSDGYIKSDFEYAISLIKEGLIKREWIEIIDPKECKEAFLKYENSEAMAIMFKF